MARDDDHLPLWTPLSMLALSIAAGAVFTLSMQREPAARPTAAPRYTAAARAQHRAAFHASAPRDMVAEN